MRVGDNVRIIITGTHYLAEMSNSNELNGVVTRGNHSIVEVALSNTEKYIVDLDDEELDYLIIRDNQSYLKSKKNDEFVKIHLVEMPKETVSGLTFCGSNIMLEIFEHVLVQNPYCKK